MKDLLNSIVDIVIINYNNASIILSCIESIYNTASEIVNDIIIVDNDSSDNSLQLIREKYPKVKIIENPSNYGYAKAVNIGVRASFTDYVIVSNSDVIFLNDSISTLTNYLINNEDVGTAGAQQLYPNGDWHRSYGHYPGILSSVLELFLLAPLSRLIRHLFWKKLPIDRFQKEVGYADGGVLAVKKQAFNNINGFDEDFFFYSEEADFCYRLKKSGWIVMFNPKAKVIHLRGATTNKSANYEYFVKMLAENKILFCKKHFTKLTCLLYIILEVIHHTSRIFLWSIYSLINNEKSKEHILRNKTLLEVYKSNLKNY